MNTIHWCGYEWITQERWGQVHPAKLQCWYDPSCVIEEKDGSISLLTRPNPKTFKIEGENKTVPCGTGLISCTEKFGFGRYEIEARLPFGKWLWPAFWMWGWGDWPPEIDVFEGSTYKESSYFDISLDSLSLWKVISNVHVDETETNYNPPPKAHWLGWVSPAKRYIKYAVEWRRDSIKFFYDDRHVYTVKNKSVMDFYSKYKMNVIINNAIKKYAPKGHTEFSIFNIKYFKYEKYE